MLISLTLLNGSSELEILSDAATVINEFRKKWRVTIDCKINRFPLPKRSDSLNVLYCAFHEFLEPLFINIYKWFSKTSICYTFLNFHLFPTCFRGTSSVIFLEIVLIITHTICEHTQKK